MKLVAFLLAFVLVSCTHITTKVSPEEQAAIQENFTKAVQDHIRAKEKKDVTSLEVTGFEQKANDEIVISYRVTCKADLQDGEKETSVFDARIRLVRKDDGVWNAVEVAPQSLKLEFLRGLLIRTTPPPGPTPASTGS